MPKGDLIVNGVFLCGGEVLVVVMMKRSVWVIFVSRVFSCFSSSIAHGDLRYGSISDDTSLSRF